MLVYLVGVVGISFLAGRWASIAASGLAVLAFNFFFIHPVHTFEVAEFQYLFTFAVMLTSAITVSELVARLRRRAAQAQALLSAREEIAAAAQEAAVEAEAERLRANLLATVSHDLRTPLATISGAASTLLQEGDQLPSSERAALLTGILEESGRLTRLVENLLQLGRLEDGAVQPRKELFPIDEIIGAALLRLGRSEGADRVQVVLPPEPTLVPVNVELVSLLIVNLLDNALKYAQTGPIRILVYSTESEVDVEVQDEGPGLPPGDADRLFERFERGSLPADGPSGTGLGLAICRAVVDAHGGSIHAERRIEGGACFRFRLPL